jgi:hypothetical protein
VRNLSDVLRKASDSLGRSNPRTAGAGWPLEDLRPGVRTESEVERLVGATAGRAVTDQIPAYAPLIKDWASVTSMPIGELFRA